MTDGASLVVPTGIASWRYLGVSVVGSSHVATGTPCQDANAVQPLGDETLLLVASDGAGSSEYSHVGARLACSSVIEEVTEHVSNGGSIHTVTPDLVDEWVTAVKSRLETEATALETPVRELGCTLVMALVTSSSSHFAQVGDGAVVVRRNGVFTAATWPANGEYANTTFFLTDDLALQRLQVSVNEPPVDEIALFTDGLQMLVLEFASRTVYQPFFERMFRPFRNELAGELEHLRAPLEEYLSSPEVCRRTDDDKSLVMASRIVPSEGQVDS